MPIGWVQIWKVYMYNINPSHSETRAPIQYKDVLPV